MDNTRKTTKKCKAEIVTSRGASMDRGIKKEGKDRIDRDKNKDTRKRESKDRKHKRIEKDMNNKIDIGMNTRIDITKGKRIDRRNNKRIDTDMNKDKGQIQIDSVTKEHQESTQETYLEGNALTAAKKDIRLKTALLLAKTTITEHAQGTATDITRQIEYKTKCNTIESIAKTTKEVLAHPDRHYARDQFQRVMESTKLKLSICAINIGIDIRNQCLEASVAVEQVHARRESRDERHLLPIVAVVAEVHRGSRLGILTVTISNKKSTINHRQAKTNKQSRSKQKRGLVLDG